MVDPLAVIIGVAGFALTVTTVAAEVAEQPDPLVTVTVYEPEALTEIDCVVAPVDHVLPVAEEEVKVTEPPEQNVVGPPADMVGVAGFEFTVTTVVVEVAEQPEPFVTVTLYEPEVFTTMDCEVAPVDHVLPVAEEEVNVTEPPEQNVVGPLAEMVGVAGLAFTVTTVDEEVAEQPEPFVTVTV